MTYFEAKTGSKTQAIVGMLLLNMVLIAKIEVINESFLP
jgi:hypothetical protein